EDRDVELLAQPLFDFEAPRGGNVLEVHAAEARRDQFDRLDYLADVLGGQTDREGVHAGELLEEHRLALHDRHRRFGADVAEAQHRGAVGDHGHGVLLDRQGEGALAVVTNRQAHPGHTRGVGHGEVVTGPDRGLVVDLDLAAQVHEERAIRDVDDPDPGQSLQSIDDLLAVHAVPGLDGDIAQDPLAPRLNQIDCTDVPPGIADSHGDPTQHSRAIGDRETHG